jgi:hypothetical protein
MDENRQVTEEARCLLGEGSTGKAHDLLTTVAEDSSDPAVLRDARQLAERGLAQAGPLGGRRWRKLLRSLPAE